MRRLIVVADVLSWEWATWAADAGAARAEALERLPWLAGRAFHLLLLPLALTPALGAPTARCASAPAVVESAPARPRLLQWLKRLGKHA